MYAKKNLNHSDYCNFLVRLNLVYLNTYFQLMSSQFYNGSTKFRIRDFMLNGVTF